jgi:tetratricopeptide (TPR) repeat protein
MAGNKATQKALQDAAEGRIDAALAAMRLQVKLNPKDLECTAVLGALLVGAGQLEQAILHLSRGVTHHPNAAMAHNNLANALMQAGRLEESAKHYERALALHPDHRQALLGLSFCRTSPRRSVASRSSRTGRRCSSTTATRSRPRIGSRTRSPRCGRCSRDDPTTPTCAGSTCSR